MKNDLSDTSTRLKVIFLGLALSLFGLQYYYYSAKAKSVIQQHAEFGISATAEVIAIHSKPGGRYRFRQPHVEYRDQSGIERQAIVDLFGTSIGSVRVGKKLSITYLPGKYDRVVLLGARYPRTSTTGQLVTGAGVLIFLVGAFPGTTKKKENSKTLVKLREEGKQLVAESRNNFNNPPAKKLVPTWRIAINVALIPVVLGFVIFAFVSEDYSYTTSGVVVSTASANGKNKVIIEYVDDRLVKRQVPLLDAHEASGLRVGQTVQIDYGSGKRDSVKLDKPPRIPFLFWYLAMFLCVMILAFNNKRTDR